MKNFTATKMRRTLISFNEQDLLVGDQGIDLQYLLKEKLIIIPIEGDDSGFNWAYSENQVNDDLTKFMKYFLDRNEAMYFFRPYKDDDCFDILEPERISEDEIQTLIDDYMHDLIISNESRSLIFQATDEQQHYWVGTRYQLESLFECSLERAISLWVTEWINAVSKGIDQHGKPFDSSIISYLCSKRLLKHSLLSIENVEGRIPQLPEILRPDITDDDIELALKRFNFSREYISYQKEIFWNEIQDIKVPFQHDT